MNEWMNEWLLIALISVESAVATLAPKTRAAMLQSPCGLLKPLCPSLLGLPINLWYFQTWQFHHTSSVTVQARFWFSSVSIDTIDLLVIVTIFLLHHAKLGEQSQNWGEIAAPAPTQNRHCTAENQLKVVMLKWNEMIGLLVHARRHLAWSYAGRPGLHFNEI